MAILKNTTILGTGSLTLPQGTTGQRPSVTTTAIRWTNTGTQSYSVLYGTTPTVTNTTWTAPTGVSEIEVLVVGGGGSGGNCQSNGGTPGGGGGAGGLVYHDRFATTPGTVYNVTVGTGGASVTTANVAGNNGADSFFGSSANLVTNGTFTSNTTSWTVPSPGEGTFTASGGRGILQQSNSSDPPVCAYQAITCVVGRTYLVVGSKFSGDTAVVNITENFTSGGGSGGPGNTLYWSGPLDQGRKVNTFVATQTTMYVTLRINTNAFPAEAQFDDIGVYDYLTAVNAIGGGGGGSDWSAGPFGAGAPARRTAYAGGSGGGGSNEFPQSATGWSASPIATVGNAVQGNNGGSGVLASGGGGAGQAGSNGNSSWGGGGNGLNYDISGTPTWYAGGGGAGATNGTFPGMGGLGGGGQGGFYLAAATAGTASTGGGGGGGSASGGTPAASGAGGSGVVIIKYSIDSNSETPTGQIRYNSDFRDVEVYETTNVGWTSRDSTKNFAPHNVIPTSVFPNVFMGPGFSGAYWTTVNRSLETSGGVFEGSNVIVGSPVGTAGGGVSYLDIALPTGTVAGVQYTITLYYKSSQRVGQIWTHDVVGNNSSATASPAATGQWIKVTNNFTTTVTGTCRVHFGFEAGAASGDQVRYTAPMIEIGSVSSGVYVPTTSAASPLPTTIGGYRTHTFGSLGRVFIVTVKAYSTYNGTRSSNYTVEYSDDGASWTTAFGGVMRCTTTGIITGTVTSNGSGTTGSGTYGAHTYWRYVEGAAVESHHPRISRLWFIDSMGVEYQAINFLGDNTADQGTYIVGTISGTAISGKTSFVPLNSGTVEVLTVGGGGGGSDYGGGGGGGVVYSSTYPVIAGTTYTVQTGNGGTGFGGFRSWGNNGGNSIFGTLTAFGGGGGGTDAGPDGYGMTQGRNGGSGGGGAGRGTAVAYSGGAGTQGQGFPGGTGGTGTYGGGGGGGAGSRGQDFISGVTGGQGGSGVLYSISGRSNYYGGGGGGGSYSAGIGGVGRYGGGNGSQDVSTAGSAGEANTGGGGGGGSGRAPFASGYNGGSGIVIVRYKSE
jgi:hypothetical protein